MSKIRKRLSTKHQEIAEKLTLMLTKSVKDQAQVIERLAFSLYCCLGNLETLLHSMVSWV